MREHDGGHHETLRQRAQSAAILALEVSATVRYRPLYSASGFLLFGCLPRFKITFEPKGPDASFDLCQNQVLL